MLFESIISGVISGGMVVALATFGFKMFMARLDDRFQNIKEGQDKAYQCIDELYSKCNKHSERLAYLEGVSNGKKEAD